MATCFFNLGINFTLPVPCYIFVRTNRAAKYIFQLCLYHRSSFRRQDCLRVSVESSLHITYAKIILASQGMDIIFPRKTHH